MTRERVLAFLAEHPGQAGKRELAKAFGLKGAQRIALKRILSELEDEGTLSRGRGRTLLPAGMLPEFCVIEVHDRDPDGELLGRPVEWQHETAPPPIILAPDAEGNGGGPALGIGDRVLARLTEADGSYEARVVRRIGASAHKVLGVFHRVGGMGRVKPVDRKSKLELIVQERDAAGAEPGDVVLAEPMAGRTLGLPRARIAERLGHMDAPRAASLIATYAHGIPVEFSARALAEAEAAAPAGLEGRTDLRDIPLITIDPPDARDHDDAVYAEPDTDPKNPGGHVVFVAIADVAHYVTPGSGLDVEARKRGNSVYFPDRVIPMLPERLSADLCSLKPDVERACLAVRMVFDAKGHKRGHKFVRGLMKSAARLTYQDVQDAADGRPGEKARALEARILKPLWAAFAALDAARTERSPLAITSRERRIELDTEGRVKSIAWRSELRSMKLIEEFMIQANVAAAEQLEAKRSPLIYRIHDQPTREKLEAYADFLDTLGQNFAKGDVVKPANFNRVLQRFRGSEHEEIVNEVTLRSQAQAVYANENIGHFGLNLLKYAHFTSPIRRYADLVVHRALIRSLRLGNDGLTDSEIPKLAETAAHISQTERRAMAAERDAQDRYLTAYMADRVGASFEGRISGVTRFGLFVKLDETGADGLLPARDLGPEYFDHDPAAHALVGQRTGLTFRLGDRVTVRLVEAVPVTGGLRFELLEGGRAGGEPGGRRRRALPSRGPQRGPQRGPKRRR